MNLLLVIAVLFVVVLVVSAPLRSARRNDALAGPQLGDLEAAREAKYREIRDADLDHRTGKLSDEDYDALDQDLRAEAIEILRSIDRKRGTAGSAGPTVEASAD